MRLLMEASVLAALEQYMGSYWNLSPITVEQFRVLYARLEQLQKSDRCQVFCVTSALQGEGKTFTAVNLAMRMAGDFGKRTLLMDLDCKRSMFKKYGSQGGLFRLGWVDVLEGQCKLNEALVPLLENRFFLLPVGQATASSSSHISALGTGSLLKSLRGMFDYVIMDAPPVLPLADVGLLEDQVDGILMVVRAGMTTRDLLVRACKSLKREKIKGLVLNDVRQSLKYYYHYQQMES